jgi:hypothetical protein
LFTYQYINSAEKQAKTLRKNAIMRMVLPIDIRIGARILDLAGSAGFTSSTGVTIGTGAGSGVHLA